MRVTQRILRRRQRALLPLVLVSGLLGTRLSPVWAQGEQAAHSAALTQLVTIESDLQKADNKTGIVTATGNVRIVYADRGVIATARQAQYFSREGRVVLSGDVDVIQDQGGSIEADRITFLVDDQRLVAEPRPGEQVMSRIPIQPPPLSDSDLDDTEAQ